MLGLVVAWRTKHPLKRYYSHYSGAHKSYDNRLIPDLTDATQHPITISDHESISCTLTRTGARHPGNMRKWRLQESLLGDPVTVTNIRNSIADYITHNNTGDTSAATRWDALKAVLRGNFIAKVTAEGFAGKTY